MTSKPDNHDKPKGQIVLDSELVALNVITKKLTALNEPARQRVLSWINVKFQPPPVNPAQ